jgi:hypothetical protein
MATINQNYNIVQGDSFLLDVTWTSPSGSAINLSGYSVNFEARDMPGGSLLCTSGSMSSIPSSGSFAGYQLSTPSASSGTIKINITGENTAFFNYPKTSYQLRVTSPSGNKSTLVKGWLNVDAGTIEQ